MQLVLPEQAYSRTFDGGPMQAKKDQNNISEPRELALNLVYEVMEKGAYTNISLDKALRSSRLSQTDKNLVTEIVNGSIRMIKHLDWVLNLFLQKPVHKQNPWLRNILRISAYQLMFMERIPDYAAVNSAVDLTRKKTSRALTAVCNGVLRNLVRQRGQYDYPPLHTLDYLSVYYSQPEWLVKDWLESFGLEAAVTMFSYLNKRAPLALRINSLRTSPAQVLENIGREGAVAVVSPLVPWSIRLEALEKSIEELSSYQQGHFYIQNEASMLAGAILDPQPGEKIMDLCCGVGGKTTHFAERMQNQGNIKAIDIYEHKMSLLEKNCQRLGITIIQGQTKDILQMEDDYQGWQRVFLDAPCSGLGVLNRRSDSRWHKKPEDVLELNQLQSRLIEKAGQMIAVGGVLVYSTCTINRSENEDIVNGFLQNNPDFELEAFDDLISFLPLDQNDRDTVRQGLLTLLPGKYDTDGMFYARLKRR